MEATFKCPDCGRVFQSDAEKFEYHSPVYGPCSKNVSHCPDCNVQSDEYREPNPGKKAAQPEPMPMHGGGGCCGGGSCGF